MKKIYFMLILNIFLFNIILADEIHLKDGRILNGEITKKNGIIELKSNLGSIYIKSENVIKIISKKTPMELFKEKYAIINKNNPEELLKLAEWCRKNNVFKYTELTRKAKTIILNEKLKNAKSNPDELFQVAIWAKQRRFSKHEYEAILNRVIGLSPEHAGARFELNQTKYKGQWINTDEAKKLEKRDFEIEMREKGFIFFRDNWVKPEEAGIIKEIEELKKQLEFYKKEQENILREKDILLDEKEQLKSKNIELEKVKKTLEDKYKKNIGIVYHNVEIIRNYLNRIIYKLNNPPNKIDENYLEEIRKIIRNMMNIVNNIEEKKYLKYNF